MHWKWYLNLSLKYLIYQEKCFSKYPAIVLQDGFSQGNPLLRHLQCTHVLTITQTVPSKNLLLNIFNDVRLYLVRNIEILMSIVNFNKVYSNQITRWVSFLKTNINVKYFTLQYLESGVKVSVLACPHPQSCAVAVFMSLVSVGRQDW